MKDKRIGLTIIGLTDIGLGITCLVAAIVLYNYIKKVSAISFESPPLPLMIIGPAFITCSLSILFIPLGILVLKKQRIARLIHIYLSPLFCVVITIFLVTADFLLDVGIRRILHIAPINVFFINLSIGYIIGVVANIFYFTRPTVIEQFN